MKNNLVLMADAYKYSHHKLYYPGTTEVYSYLESRGGKFDNTIFFGLQYLLKEYLVGKAFSKQDVDKAEPFLEKVFGRSDVFNRKKFDYILDKYDGCLPIRIKAVPEGTVVPTSNVLMTIENTDPNCFWLTNFLETLLVQAWYPITVATISREVKKVVASYYELTASEQSKADIDFVLNDFGFRGVSSVESAAIGGAAHLINFNGSDTLAGSVMAQEYYNTDKVYGMSIPATEHSICTLLGREGELEVFRHVIDTFPTGLVACVSDSYDIFNACANYWGGELKDKILKRDGVLVIRPDSGDPLRTLLKVFEILMDKLGYAINEKGYKVLPKSVKVIQGDGVNYDSIRDIYKALYDNGISAQNLVLGMGGALLQKLDRDTQKFAMKCSYAKVDGKDVIVQKSPTELNEDGQLVSSFKKSKGGKLKLIKLDGQYKTVNQEEYPEVSDEMVTVFENGKLLIDWSFDEIRKRAEISETELSTIKMENHV